jgi:hypothetical protein
MKQYSSPPYLVPSTSRWTAFFVWLVAIVVGMYGAGKWVEVYALQNGLYPSREGITPLEFQLQLTTIAFFCLGVSQFVGARFLLPLPKWWIPIPMLVAALLTGGLGIALDKPLGIEDSRMYGLIVTFLGVFIAQSVMIQRIYGYGLRWFSTNILGFICSALLLPLTESLVMSLPLTIRPFVSDASWITVWLSVGVWTGTTLLCIRTRLAQNHESTQRV